MKLQTSIPFVKASPQIDYSSKLMLLGSCFAEHIASKLKHYQFQSTSNPFGILFNPVAIEKLLHRSLERQRYAENELFYLNGLWHCFDAHSDLSRTSNKEALDALNKALDKTHEQVIEASHIIITLGTAWVYRHAENKRVVANCHKVPQKEFTKELLPVEEITKALRNILTLVESANKSATVLFTVSPVRHLKDGFVENNRSKAHLITAIHSLVDGKAVKYFPSYELVMDELRDYRYYARDMVHPNELAVDYVWERFKEVWIDAHSLPIMEAVDQVQKGLQHRPLHPESENHKEFVKSLKSSIAKLKSEHPHMRFDK